MRPKLWSRVSQVFPYCDFYGASLCGEVEGGVSIVAKIRILDAGWIVFHDSLDECEVIENDCPPKANRNLNPIGKLVIGRLEEIRSLLRLTFIPGLAPC